MTDSPKRRSGDNGFIGNLKFTITDVVKIVAVIASIGAAYYALDKRVFLVEYQMTEIRDDVKFMKRAVMKIASEIGAINLPTEAGTP